MSGIAKGQRERSKVVTGFHRLGVVLAVPLLLGALGAAISAWFSNDGPYVPDPGVPPGFRKASIALNSLPGVAR